MGRIIIIFIIVIVTWIRGLHLRNVRTADGPCVGGGHDLYCKQHLVKEIGLPELGCSHRNDDDKYLDV